MSPFRGRNIVQIDEPPSSYAELVRLLARLNVRDSLRTLGRVFAQVDAAPGRQITVHGVLVPSHVIPPLALELVLASDDTKTGQIDERYFAQLVRCFHGLPWPSTEGDTFTETLLRMGESQFSFQKSDPYKWERTVRIFREIWPTIPQARSLDIQLATKGAFGIELEEMLLFGFAFGAQAYSRGYVTQYLDAKADHVLTRHFTEAAQARFLTSLSATYDIIRREASRTDLPDDLRRFRFNPMALYPLVLPDAQPSGVTDRVYLAPCARFLLDRITDGLRVDCWRQFGDAFNNAFGYVIERYVGDLLIETYGNRNVKDERSSRAGRRKPDWIVLGNGCAIIIEVKKAILHQRIRAAGVLSRVREDLQRTLQTALNQLVDFRAKLSFREYPSKSDVELVIVTWDDTWWANSILMHQVHGVPEGLHIHIISVRELEILLSQCKVPDALYQTLWNKHHSNADGAEMDMTDWLARQPGGGLEETPPANLVQTRQRFIERWGLQ